MKVIYDRVADILIIIFKEAPVTESDEDKPGVNLDYGPTGYPPDNAKRLEILKCVFSNII